ncbi:MAG: methylenetetrahydrofolate reductase [NAD(P)H] [Candidatus Muproteobacteria bacterium RIFCSPHIGHO2_01_FULL_65_16]|uniref:Methylenetetrahydrofolate reductase n=1 Tax=Candidatus Muproteobacteria bacterium RIFCSPHIGHO2_01_FULL_65_16 TaxID=1817764 RepID=A0A1F6TK52_9PROT|nr:MAG: methylenetetrahydrofolate reductase [NAD(P)H] [Candidatus Muproteobacteria bacterium RIFCSPHIGHO2_01_FULL_65_16]
MNSQKKFPRAFSFEFFPPKDDDGRAGLRDAINQLAPLKPKFFSVTFGAGGGIRAGTYETVKEIQARGLTAAPHITCTGTTRADVKQLLRSYRELGIGRIVALRGDRPKDAPAAGDFSHANELVAFIRAETGRHFHIEVAAYPEIHPEAPSAATDLENFARKVRAGADSAITQYFYNPDAYRRFVDDCEALGLDIPIVPGIMPITNYKQLARFSDGCGAEIPRWVRKRLEGYGDDLDALRAFGLDVTTALCEKLLAAGAPGLHFYTLNRAGAARALWERLGL